MGASLKSKTLKRLVLEEIKGITDTGVDLLRKMCSLEQLNVSSCLSNYWPQLKITDIGGVAILCDSDPQRIETVCLERISDATIVALAENCINLEIFDLNGCHEVRGDGIRAFSSHKCLKRLVLLGMGDFDLSDVESIALGCPLLESVVVDLSLRLDPAWSSELLHDRTKSVIKFSQVSY